MGRVGSAGEAEMRSDWHRYNWQCYGSTSLKPAPPQSLLTDGEENSEKPSQWSLQGLQVTPCSIHSSLNCARCTGGNDFSLYICIPYKFSPWLHMASSQMQLQDITDIKVT